ncbi:CRISPR-associated endonuclease Cas2 [Konateibacter massiliensis]|uniref:CRISPR-associated endonuclease Cas2 n=1 Tax=Konateibacter massiliensis TaxID=2002841 RepID=UPI000C14D3B2|nr:CRISPR-associated endonuclease Cas2 [Konateibacter massiliensis]
MYVILVYDICGEGNGQKVLNKTFKTCKKYLSHIQNSVFEGELTEAQIMKLHKELDAIIRKEIDSVILFQSRNERWLEKSMWGMQEDLTSNFL